MGFLDKLFGRSPRDIRDENRGSRIAQVRSQGRDLITVGSVFQMTGRGYVIAGTLQQDASVGQPVEVLDAAGMPIDDRTYTVRGIEKLRETMQHAPAGTEVGVLVCYPPEF